MKEVMEQYGSTVIAISVASILFVLLTAGNFQGKKGILEAVGGIYGIPLKETVLEHGTDSYKAYGKNEKPVIVRSAFQEGFTGTPYDMDLLCEAKDAQGKALEVIPLRIWDDDNLDCPIYETNGRYYFIPGHSGVYHATICATDEWNQKTYGKVQFPIQEKVEGIN